MKIQIVFLFLIVSFPLFSRNMPLLTGPVVDTASLLSTDEKKALSQKMILFRTETKSQIAVCIINTTGDLTIEDYSIKLAESWKIGRAKIDDGIIILVALKDRKMRIEVGYGLEDKVTDLAAGRIIANNMVPNFKNGKFYQGFNESIDALTTIICGKTYNSSYVSPAIPAVKDIPSSIKNSGTAVKTNYLAGLILGIGSFIFLILTMMNRKIIAIIIAAVTFFFFRYIGLQDSLSDAMKILLPGMIPYGILMGFIFILRQSSTGSYSSSSSTPHSSTTSSSSSSDDSSSSSFSGDGGSFGGGGASDSW